MPQLFLLLAFLAVVSPGTRAAPVECADAVTFCNEPDQECCCDGGPVVCVCCTVASQTCGVGPVCVGGGSSSPSAQPTPTHSPSPTPSPSASVTRTTSPTRSLGSSPSPTRTPSPSDCPQVDSGGLPVVDCGRLAGGTLTKPLVVEAPLVVVGALVVPSNASVGFVAPGTPVVVQGSLVLNGTVVVQPGATPSTSGTEFELFRADNITLGSDFEVEVDYEPERACERVDAREREDAGSLSVVLTLDESGCKSGGDDGGVQTWMWLVPLVVVLACCVIAFGTLVVPVAILRSGRCFWLFRATDRADFDSVVNPNLSRATGGRVHS